MTVPSMAIAADTANCLLASYPKSGNTWVRALLTALRGTGHVDLNDLEGTNRLANATLVEAEVAVDPTELTLDELDEVRAELYRRSHRPGSPYTFHKTHAVNRTLPSGRRLVDERCGRAIYVIRHPFDVAVSYSHFIAVDLDEIVTQMLNVHAVLDRPSSRRSNVLPECLSSWTEHVASWCVEPALPTLVVRYEDLLADTAQQLARIARFLGLDATDAAIAGAVESSRFDRLQQAEAETGFAMKPATAERFFRSGVRGEGGRTLSRDNRARLVAAFHQMMDRYGFAPNGDTVIIK